MNRSYQRGPKGVRGDRKSGSKVTNLTTFQPYWSSTETIYRKYFNEFNGNYIPTIFVDPTNEDFIFPVSKADIQSVLDSIPEEFIFGIEAILVPSGSKKQAKTAYGLGTLGEYWNECVILHPFPKILMTARFKKHQKPSDHHFYERAGAIITQDDFGLEIKFDEESLKRFYLNGILMHEIGHHNECYKKRPIKKRERFAEWFEIEYGYRLRK